MNKILEPVKFRMGQLFGNPAPMYTAFGLKGHNGLDMSCPTGTPVVSCLDGVVEFVGEDSSAGKGVYVISKLDGVFYRFIYWHFRSFSVSVGDKIKQGDVVGISDNTGMSTGPHLHFGMKPVEFNGFTWTDTIHNNGFNGAVDPFNFFSDVIYPVIKEGMFGQFVLQIQDFLNHFGATLIVDGKYGPKTKQAVKDYQLSHGLVPDGMVGSLTINSFLKNI